MCLSLASNTFILFVTFPFHAQAPLAVTARVPLCPPMHSESPSLIASEWRERGCLKLPLRVPVESLSQVHLGYVRWVFTDKYILVHLWVGHFSAPLLSSEWHTMFSTKPPFFAPHFFFFIFLAPPLSL
jgi:hypothetical protein